MIAISVFLIVVLMISGYLFFLYFKKDKDLIHEKSQGIPEDAYVNKNPLTKAELKAYLLLKEKIKTNHILLSQVRLADLISVNTKKYKHKSSDWYVFFNKIKSKHCDFLIIDEITGNVIIAIELDDYTHRNENRINRDIEVNYIFSCIGINLIRCNDVDKICEDLSKSGY